MDDNILNIYKGALNNKRFIEEVRQADNDKPPTILSDETTKHFFASIYYGWLIGVFGIDWEAHINN